MDELKVCPECGVRALAKRGCLDCFASNKAEKPKRKAAKKKPTAKKKASRRD